MSETLDTRRADEGCWIDWSDGGVTGAEDTHVSWLRGSGWWVVVSWFLDRRKSVE
jgi:hypothetical protein